MKKFNLLIILIFSFLLFIGLRVYKDYGISWDEPSMRLVGTHAFNYVFKGENQYLTERDRYYGNGMELVFLVLEKGLNLGEDVQNLYFVRHLIGYLFYLLGLYFFFLLCKNLFKSNYYAFFGLLFFILSPIFFAHAFFNCKDIPFMVSMLASIYFSFKYLDNKEFKNLIYGCFFSAFAILNRNIGILCIVFLGLLMFFDFINKKMSLKKSLIRFFIYLALVCLLIFMFWPVLWNKPLYNFWQSFVLMGHFPWDQTVRYMGNDVLATNIPWHYLFVWIGITTPPLYVFNFLIGNFFLMKDLRIKNKFDIKKIILILWFWFPIIIILLTKSVLYDSWRHVFFVYPAFLLISLFGFRYILDKFKRFFYLKFIYYLLLIFQIVKLSLFMVINHPFQNVYFSILAGDKKNISSKFEVDYWGASYKQGYEYLLSHIQDEEVKIFVNISPREYNVWILDPNTRSRIIRVDKIEEADYYLTNYRFEHHDLSKFDVFKIIKVGEIPVMGIYKIK